jgi:hypothetical protein
MSSIAEADACLAKVKAGFSRAMQVDQAILDAGGGLPDDIMPEVPAANSAQDVLADDVGFENLMRCLGGVPGLSFQDAAWFVGECLSKLHQCAADEERFKGLQDLLLDTVDDLLLNPDCGDDDSDVMTWEDSEAQRRQWGLPLAQALVELDVHLLEATSHGSRALISTAILLTRSADCLKPLKNVAERNIVFGYQDLQEAVRCVSARSLTETEKQVLRKYWQMLEDFLSPDDRWVLDKVDPVLAVCHSVDYVSLIHDDCAWCSFGHDKAYGELRTRAFVDLLPFLKQDDCRRIRSEILQL